MVFVALQLHEDSVFFTPATASTFLNYLVALHFVSCPMTTMILVKEEAAEGNVCWVDFCVVHGMAAAGLSAGAQPSVLDGQHSSVFGFPRAYGVLRRTARRFQAKPSSGNFQ